MSVDSDLFPIREPQQEETQAPARLPSKRRARLMMALIVLLLLMAVNLAIGSRKVLFEKVVSGSMEPTLLIGDEIVADANARPKLYDIIILADPTNSRDKLVKRLVGLPGDEVSLRDGELFINGTPEKLQLANKERISWRDVQFTVPRDKIFVMGDNRNNSYDSLNFGAVPMESVQGVVTTIIWPPSRWGRPQSRLVADQK